MGAYWEPPKSAIFPTQVPLTLSIRINLHCLGPQFVVPLRWYVLLVLLVCEPQSIISCDSMFIYSIIFLSLVYPQCIQLACCTCYHTWSCNKPFCETLHLDISMISWHSWFARCPALRTNVPLWRCGWATCAVLSRDFLHVYCLFSNTYKQALFRNVLKSFEVWSHFQISSSTFQRKTIGIFNLINLAFESTAALRTSILVTLPPKTFSILSSSSSSEDTCETSEAMEENILYWWILIFEGLELLSSILGQLCYYMLSYHIMVDQPLASSMSTYVYNNCNYRHTPRFHPCQPPPMEHFPEWWMP